MVRSTFLLLWLVVQLSFRGIEGDYQVLVTVHSLLLLESRCAECYKAGDPIILRDSCCDGNNASSCPDSCDVLLRFCELGDLSQSPLADRLVSFGTQCVQNPLSSYVEDWLGFNLKAGVTYPDFDEENLTGGILFRTDVIYNETGQWKGAQLSISVIDTESDDLNDLIDYFSIPINISAGSSVSNTFTGIYNYVQFELTIEVRCTAQNNRGENCICLPGFTGPLCELEDSSSSGDCTRVICNNGGKCVDGSCECGPAYTGAMCESEVPVEMTTSSSTGSDSPAAAAAAVPVVVIAVGVVGGVLFSLTLVILILILALLIFWGRRTKSVDIQGSTTNSYYGSGKVVLRSGDMHIYDEAAGNGTNITGTSESEVLKEFNNPIYGDEPEPEHEYEATDKFHSGSQKDNDDQYQELERKFENPIYGDEDDENLNNPIPAHESNIDYDQVGNVYHTLESEQDRQQRYTEPGRGHSEQTTAAITAASVEMKNSSKGQTGKPHHSYEDVQ